MNLRIRWPLVGSRIAGGPAPPAMRSAPGTRLSMVWGPTHPSTASAVTSGQLPALMAAGMDAEDTC
eukprot:141041-Chlamydomonas_euryale.AAC.2